MCSFSPLCLVYFINNNYYYSTLETDVCVWRYATIVVLATKEEEEEDYIYGYSIESNQLLIKVHMRTVV